MLQKETLLDVRGLQVSFRRGKEYTKVVSDLSFTMARKESLGIVGESGSGKSVTSLATMGLLPPKTRIEGEIIFAGQDVLQADEKEMQQLRGNRMAMIFQEPMTSLNPLHTCGAQIAESLRIHQKLGKKEAMAKALALLEQCGIPDAEQRLHEYPHQLSGGMRQRIMIAIALACDPDLLIADEPTTALDVTIQAQILDLLSHLRETRNMGVIMITHDLGVVHDFCDRVLVVYTGEVVEIADVKALFATPLHPYTEGLLAALPQAGLKSKRLSSIEGTVPDFGKMPEGCHFHPRCPYAVPRCSTEHPTLRDCGDGRFVRCFREVEGD